MTDLSANILGPLFWREALLDMQATLGHIAFKAIPTAYDGSGTSIARPEQSLNW